MSARGEDVRPCTVDAHPVRLSGLLAEPAQAPPRATVVALPGAGMRAAYFHGPVDSAGSLLDLGAAAGFTVLALDRPGYGDSIDAPEEHLRLLSQVDVLHAALDTFEQEHDIGAGYFVVAHSYGLKVALALAGDRRGDRFLGLDGVGTGVHYVGSTTLGGPFAAPAAGDATVREPAEVPLEVEVDRGAVWGPEHYYPEGTFDRGRLPVARIPEAQTLEFAEWPDALRSFAGDIHIPLRLGYGERDALWATDDETLGELRELFTAAPSVTTHLIHGAGHNVSLSVAARAYHLAALAFAEECMVRAAL